MFPGFRSSPPEATCQWIWNTQNWISRTEPSGQPLSSMQLQKISVLSTHSAASEAAHHSNTCSTAGSKASGHATSPDQYCMLLQSAWVLYEFEWSCTVSSADWQCSPFKGPSLFGSVTRQVVSWYSCWTINWKHLPYVVHLHHMTTRAAAMGLCEFCICFVFLSKYIFCLSYINVFFSLSSL